MVVIHCDNQAVVSVLRSGHTRDMTLAAMARNISMAIAYWDIELVTVHIEGKLNVIADTLSRLSINLNLIVRGHGGRVVTLSPPTSEAGVWFPAWPQVGKLVVACRWSAVYSTEP